MSSPKEVREDRQYTKDHEWARLADNEVIVGITAFAVDQLGDVTMVSIDVKPGDAVQAGRVFGTIESVKTLSDLYAPISGKVTRVNDALENSPELINDDCWDKGWMIAIEPAKSTAETGGLLDAASYLKHIQAEH
jgi:glycine cleavage system H protein